MSALRRIPADPTDAAVLERVARHLGEGGLIAYPTETVYGLGGPASPEAIRRVRALKGGERSDPFLLLVGSRAAVELDWNPPARRLADVFWPGPLTLILGDPEGKFPEGVRNESGGVAVRVSPHPFARALATVWDAPLVSTSANRSGGSAPSTPDEVEGSLGKAAEAAGVLLIDGGVLPPSPPSTVLDCMRSPPRVVREGATPVRALREVVPELTGPA